MQLLWDRNAFKYVMQLGLEPLWSSRGDGFQVLFLFIWNGLYFVQGNKTFLCVCVDFNKVSSVGSFNHLT